MVKVRLFLIAVCALSSITALIFLPPLATAQSVRLGATFHRQEHALSCEIATLKMALGVHGIDISEQELIAQLPFDPTPKGGGVWGDPNQGFVGNIDGKMLINGYGVYWDPIAAVGNRYAQTTVLEHGSPQELARHLSAGNPIIIWGYYGSRQTFSWQTPAGKAIKAVNSEHTRLVYGFDGSLDAPTRFYLIDPLIGPMSWSTEQLMHNWSGLEHMGVVVAPPLKWVRVPNDSAVWELDTVTHTRRWITTWEAFEQRGGSPQNVTPIAAAALHTYTLKSPLK